MSEMNEHRQAIVRALIHSVRDLDSKVSPLAFTDNGVQEKEQEEHPCLDVCIATSLLFPHNDTCGLGCLSAGCITFSNYGPLWMGLWLDIKVILHDGENKISVQKLKQGIEDHGNTLFPRWLAEVLNHECELDIIEEDIYDEPARID